MSRFTKLGFYPSYVRHSYCSITCYHRICFLFLINFHQVRIFHIFLTLLFFMQKLFKFSKILIYMLHSVNFFGDHTNIDVGVGRKLSISIWHETIVIFISKDERGLKWKRAIEEEGREKRRKKISIGIFLLHSDKGKKGLNYSVQLSRLMKNLLLMSNKCNSHIGELLSS